MGKLHLHQQSTNSLWPPAQNIWDPIDTGTEGVINPQQIDCLFNSLFRLITNSISNICITSPLWGNTLVTGGFSSQRASNMGSFSVSGHHVRPQSRGCTSWVLVELSICAEPRHVWASGPSTDSHYISIHRAIHWLILHLASTCYIYMQQLNHKHHLWECQQQMHCSAITMQSHPTYSQQTPHSLPTKVSCGIFFLTYCGLMMPYGDRDLGQHWLR